MKFGEEKLGEYVHAYFVKYPSIAAIPVDIISLAFHAAVIIASIIAILLINKELRAIDSDRASLLSRRKDSFSKSQERHS